MKKIFIFILVFLALFIVSCKDDGYIDDPNEDGLYENISSVKYDDFKEIYINFAEQDTFFTLRIPSVWEIIKDDSKYKITLNDKDIGVIYKGPAQDLDKWKNVYSSEIKGFTCTILINTSV